jgi:AcrR family transcriptional regulator
MPRPRSEGKRAAILSAATCVIATQGLAAPTAMIAREAGVSNGSLFVYFETKVVLLNELYIALKSEMGTAAMVGLPPQAEPRELVRHMWTQWLGWATSNPDRRRVLAQLEVAEEISAESHRSVLESQQAMAALVERSRAGGPMQDVALGFVLTLVSAMADATMDAMIRDPDLGEAHAAAAFEAIWRVLAGGPPATARTARPDLQANVSPKKTRTAS